MSEEDSSRDATMRHRLPKFFVLAFALAVPFWVLGAYTTLNLLPGLPIAALATFSPALAGTILVYAEDGGAGVAAFLRRSLDFGRIKSKVWYVPVLLLMPAIMTASFGVARLSGVPVPLPRIALVPTVILGVVFFVAALGEELGWSGYATDPMQARWGALGAAIILGGIWVVYHYLGLVEVGRSTTWIEWWALNTLALRVIIVWLYDNTGRSVFATALFHMTINVTWQLYPVNGSFFDPRLTGLITAAVAVVVVIVYGPRTLRRRDRVSRSQREAPPLE